MASPAFHRRLDTSSCRAALTVLVLASACGSGATRISGSGGGGGSDALGPQPIADEPIPAAAFHVAPTGDDAGPGSAARPWRSLPRALQALQPGDTLVLRGGTWFVHGLTIALAGTATRPIVVRHAVGETPILDAGLPQFRSAGNQDWTLHDAAAGIYRSVATFAGLGQVYGYLDDAAGGHRLVPYERYAALAASGEDYSEASEFYVGPGVFWSSSDQHIYVRLQPTRYHARTGTAAVADVDPRRTPMVVFPARQLLDVRPAAAHLQLRGLHLRHGGTLADLPSGCHHLTLRDCELRPGRYGLILRSGVHDVLLDGLRVDGRFPPYVARSDVKRPAAGPPAHLLQDAAVVLEGAVDALEIRNSTFTGLFDAIDSSDTPTNVRVHHCEFTTIRDDVFEIATAGHHIAFDHNLVRRAAAAVSRNGATAPPSDFAGTKFVHHNVLDISVRQLYGRDDPAALLPTKWRGPSGDGMATGTAFGTHDTAGMNGADPFCIYHNTIVGGADVDGEGLGIAYRFPRHATVPQQVCNNVFVQLGDQWIARGARVDDGSQHFDGNVYHRGVAAPATALFEAFAGNGSTQRHASLVAFTTSAQWLLTRTGDSAGWELLGREGNPQLDAQYRPVAGGPADGAGADLTRLGWPDCGWLPYRGAVAPR